MTVINTDIFGPAIKTIFVRKLAGLSLGVYLPSGWGS